MRLTVGRGIPNRRLTGGIVLLLAAVVLVVVIVSAVCRRHD